MKKTLLSLAAVSVIGATTAYAASGSESVRS
jgi:hypothetical protein